MIKLKTILFLLFCVFFKAQNNFIIYDKIIDLSDGSERIQEKNILFFNSNNSYYFNYRGEIEKINDFFDGNEKIKSSQIIKNSFKNSLYIKDNSFTKDALFTKDNFNEFNWKISKKTKKILGYNCFEAETTYRGRNYIAWFTLDLPIEIGPYKFRGLPGIILSIQDKDKLFSFEAIRINLNMPLKINIEDKLSFQFPVNDIDYISYKDYISKENEYLKGMRSRINANRPNGLIVISESKERDYKIEKSFEWEEIKKP